MEEKWSSARPWSARGSQCSIDEFELPYDRVVIAVGATTNTLVPGVREHCLFLKQIQDADNLARLWATPLNERRYRRYPPMKGGEP